MCRPRPLLTKDGVRFRIVARICHRSQFTAAVERTTEGAERGRDADRWRKRCRTTRGSAIFSRQSRQNRICRRALASRQGGGKLSQTRGKHHAEPKSAQILAENMLRASGLEAGKLHVVIGRKYDQRRRSSRSPARKGRGRNCPAPTAAAAAANDRPRVEHLDSNS